MSIIGRAMSMTPMALGNSSGLYPESLKQELPGEDRNSQWIAAFFSDSIVIGFKMVGHRVHAKLPLSGLWN